MKQIIPLLLFLLISCSNKSTLEGRWVSYDGVIDCELFENNTYAFPGRNPFNGEPSKGFYKFKNDTLSLYANKTDKKPYMATKITFISKDEITFEQLSLRRKE
ncbi:MAG: hypothetical protein EOO46_08380 [Flavobacterium sp.]|nr:MAG: hypothetical protein EOO46_08380 [Flavobacterium sp.]